MILSLIPPDKFIEPELNTRPDSHNVNCREILILYANTTMLCKYVWELKGQSRGRAEVTGKGHMHIVQFQEENPPPKKNNLFWALNRCLNEPETISKSQHENN